MALYTLNTTADAIDSKMSKEMGKAVNKTYEQGEDVLAEDYKDNDKYLIIDKRYILPKNVLTEKESILENKKDINESESILDRANIKGTTTNSVRMIADRSKAYKNGLVYGAALGLLAGLILRKKLVWFTIGGALVGGHLSLELEKGKKIKHEVI